MTATTPAPDSLSPLPDLDLRAHADAEVVVLPEAFDGDSGIYAEWMPGLVRILRQSGVAVAWATDGNRRVYRSEHSADLETMIQIGMLILNPDAKTIIQATVEYLVGLLGSKDEPRRLRYRIFRRVDPSTGHPETGAELDLNFPPTPEVTALVKEINEGLARLAATDHSD